MDMLTPTPIPTAALDFGGARRAVVEGVEAGLMRVAVDVDPVRVDETSAREGPVVFPGISTLQWACQVSHCTT